MYYVQDTGVLSLRYKSHENLEKYKIQIRNQWISLITNPALCRKVQAQLLVDYCVRTKTMVVWLFGLCSCCFYMKVCFKLGMRALGSVLKIDDYSLMIF